VYSDLFTIMPRKITGLIKLRALAILYLKHKKREETSLFVSSQSKKCN
jgi:hypothetical protein